MRANIVIDEKLRCDTLRATGLKTEREAVELGLRTRGVWVRKTIDTLIATRCIESGFSLLYSTRDFDPYVVHPDLRSAL